jgi:hypothetical protein
MQPCPQDNTSDYVKAQVESWIRYPSIVIHAEMAREIAAWWAQPENDFALFACAGIVNHSFLVSIQHEILNTLKASVIANMTPLRIIDDVKVLLALETYIRDIPPW